MTEQSRLVFNHLKILLLIFGPQSPGNKKMYVTGSFWGFSSTAYVSALCWGTGLQPAVRRLCKDRTTQRECRETNTIVASGSEPGMERKQGNRYSLEQRQATLKTKEKTPCVWILLSTFPATSEISDYVPGTTCQHCKARPHGPWQHWGRSSSSLPQSSLKKTKQNTTIPWVQGIHEFHGATQPRCCNTAT